MITVSVDSALMKEFQNRREYAKIQKAWAFPGVGCVATWGSLTGNKIAHFLGSQSISPSKHTVNDLAQLVETFLKREYQPHKEPLDDVGYHVAGFDRQRNPRLHHKVWGIERPAPQGQPNFQKYHSPQHHPRPGQRVFLYNGRNDLAETVINVLLNEVRSGQDTNFELNEPVDQVRFADLVLRFAAELTPQVAPPFRTFILTPENQVGCLVNRKLEPINRSEIESVLSKLRIGI